ncbi:hypothetical protein P7266_0854 [Lactococcus cremoris]|nr:hypothetical protein P7266_0854 [Lactococcus cremoris]
MVAWFFYVKIRGLGLTHPCEVGGFSGKEKQVASGDSVEIK